MVQSLFLKAREKHGVPNLKLPPHLVTYFGGYRWPGNVRELENIIERLTVLAVGDEITLSDLPEFLRRERAGGEGLQLELPPQGISLEGVEKELDLEKRSHDSMETRPRRLLFWTSSRRTLIYRMEKHGRFHREPGEAAEA